MPNIWFSSNAKLTTKLSTKSGEGPFHFVSNGYRTSVPVEVEISESGEQISTKALLQASDELLYALESGDKYESLSDALKAELSDCFQVLTDGERRVLSLLQQEMNDFQSPPYKVFSSAFGGDIGEDNGLMMDKCGRRLGMVNLILY